MGILDAPGLAPAIAKGLFPPVPIDMGFVAGATHPLTRRVPHVVGASKDIIAASALSFCQRTVIVMPLQSVRWRLKVANRSTLTNSALTTPVTVTGAYLGTPVVSTASTVRRWTGDATAALTQAVGTLVVPTDGTAVRSGWVTDAALQFAPNVARLLSLGITATATGNGISADTALQAAVVPTAGAGKAGDAVVSSASGFISPGGAAGAVWYLDVQIEYEFVGTNKIGLFVGDSNTAGFTQGDILGQAAGTLTHEAWPGVAALRKRFAHINLGVPSATYDTFASTANFCLSRVDLSATTPDFAVIALGTNQLSFYSTAIGKYQTVIDQVLALGVPRSRIYLCTIPPRSDHAALFGTITAPAAAGATSITATVAPGNGLVFSLGNGRSSETPTAGAATGSGPYTIPTSALTKAHAAGEQILLSNEFNRQWINDWMGQVPYGVAGCIDFEAVSCNKGDWSTPDMRLFNTDGLHYLRRLHQRFGALVAEAVAPAL